MAPHRSFNLSVNKNKKKLFLFISVFAIFFLFFAYFATSFAAGTPSIISYQGRLADSSGNLLGGSGTPYYFKFSIWDSATVGTGNKLWPASNPGSSALTVRDGVFNVNIGDTDAGFPDTLNYNFNTSRNVYLQVEVSSDNATFQTLGPRQRMASAPFAELSGAVSGSTNQSSFGTTSPVANSVVTVEATSTTATAVTINAIAGQIANIFSVRGAGGNNLVTIDAAGGIFASSSLNVSGNTNLTNVTISGLTTFSSASTTLISALSFLISVF